jgi:lipopolysaccharide/colanic/teichoic acid biosynthesis glycosyltransferase
MGVLQIPAQRTSTRAADELVAARWTRARNRDAAWSGSGDRVIAAPVPDFARRCLNLAAASALLVVVSPLMLVVAAAIKLTSPGSIFFTQVRVGLDRRNGHRPAANCRRRSCLGGKPFTIYKFRTMRADARNGDQQVWAEPDDPRVTPLGRVLRRYRMDELPQLINVLRGEMNLVGPRPEQPNIFARLREEIERYADRQRVRPGITGWAQVNLPYDLSVDAAREKVERDLEYIDRQSVREDLKIMFRTVPVVIFKKGAW